MIVSIQEVRTIHLLGAAVSRNSSQEYSTQQVQVAWEEETHLLCTFTDKDTNVCANCFYPAVSAETVHAKTWMLAAPAAQNLAPASKAIQQVGNE